MKKITCLLLVSIALVCQFTALKAQTAKSTIYTVQTQYLKNIMDSTERATLVAMLEEYHTKVTMKNEFVLSERTMWHFWTEDSRELVTISEYADWNSIEKAADRGGELEKQAWPDAKQRSEFMKKMNSNFTHHKDAIYRGLPKLTK